MNAAEVKAYAERTPKELEALEEAVAKLGRPGLLPLDRTYASLDRLEDWLLLVLDGQAKGSKKEAMERAVRYAGETVIAQTGGRWASGAPDAELAITGQRGAPAVKALPSHSVARVERWRWSGTLRDELERQDVELQRRTLAELTADLPATLARLRADLKAFTGEDPGPLDPDAALGPCSVALPRLNVATAPRELRRRIRQGAAVAMGEVLQAGLGRAEWTVEDHPRDIDLGAWTLFGLRLSNSVARLKADDGPDALRRWAERMIAKRKDAARPAAKSKKAKSPEPAKTKTPRVVAKPRAGRRGTWWVLCSSKKARPLKTLRAKLGGELRGSFLVLTGPGDGDTVEVHVAFTKGAVIAAEAAEVADEHGADRPDHDRIAAFDARYELSWNLAESEHTFELYYTLAFRLTDLVQGITLDRVEGRFVEA